MRGLLICPMDAQTATQVAALEQICFARPWSLAALEGELRNPLAIYLVALEEGKVVGYAGMHCILGEGYITNLATAPNARRKGVARALLEALLVHAHEQVLTLLTLEVRPSNAAAAALYGGLGFAVAGRRKGYYDGPREDALIMTLELRGTK